MQKRRVYTMLLRTARLVAMAVLVAGTATLVFAQAGNTGQPAGNKSKKYVATKEIVRDEATGQLRKPTDEETQALVDTIVKLTNRSSDGLTVTQNQDGMKSAMLDGRLSGVVLGRALENGTVEVRCVTTLQEAIDFLGLEESTPQQ